MPREVYIIDDFSGGLVNAISPRNRKDNEMGELTDCFVSDKGKVELVGYMKNYLPAKSYITLERGSLLKWPDQNIFAFKSDISNYTTKLPSRADYEYYAIPSWNDNSSGGNNLVWCDIYSAYDTIRVTQLNLNTTYAGGYGTNTPSISYYIADGALRICDGANWEHNRVWYGVIDRTLFPNATVKQTLGPGLHGYNANIDFPPDGSVASTGTGSLLGLEAAYTTKSTTELGGVNTNGNYTAYNQAISTNDFNTAWTTANLSMDLVDSITLQVGCYGKLGEDWVTTFAIRAGALSAGVFALAKYQWYYDAGSAIYSKSVWQTGEESQNYTHTISFPEGLDISGGGSARLAVQNLVNTSTAPFRVEYVRFKGRSLATGTVGGYYPSGAGAVGLVIGNSTKEADYWVGNFNFGVSYVYDEGQESLIKQVVTEDGEDFIYLTKAPYLKTCLKWSNGWGKRISGVNVYCKKHGESTWLSFVENNFVTGQAYKTGTEEKYPVVYSTANSGYEFMVAPTTYEPFLSHESKTGIPSGTTTLNAKWKTATVTNRIAYVGSVKMGEKYYEDAIFKSYVNKFDTFSKDRRLEANINDGAEIIHLESYNDKLFEFKTDKINVINVSDPEGEYLEETFYHNSISHRRNVVKTEFGLFWLNQIGVFWHDGERIQELFYEIKDPSRRRISRTYWESLLNYDTSVAVPYTVKAAKNLTIGYDNIGKTLMIIDPKSPVGLSLLYNLQTDAWFQASNIISTVGEQIVDIFSGHNGQVEKMSYAGDLLSSSVGVMRILFYDATPHFSTAVKISTKDIDMGYPGLKKNLYQVYITSKGAGGSVRVRYSVNGSEDYKLPLYSDVTSDVISSATSLANSSRASRLWSSSTTVSQRFYVPDFVSTRNKHSFRVWLDFIRSTLVSSSLSVPATFQLEDISLIYRGRGKR